MTAPRASVELTVNKRNPANQYESATISIGMEEDVPEESTLAEHVKVLYGQANEELVTRVIQYINTSTGE